MSVSLTRVTFRMDLPEVADGEPDVVPDRLQILGVVHAIFGALLLVKLPGVALGVGLPEIGDC